MLLTRKSSGRASAPVSSLVASLERGVGRAIPTMDRRSFLRRSMVGMARPTPRSRLETSDDTGALPRPEDLRVSSIVISVDGAGQAFVVS